MKYQLLMLITSFLITTQSYAGKYQLLENSYKELMKSNVPALMDIETKQLSTQLQKSKFKESFQAQAYVNYGHSDTKEKSMIPFQPIFKTSNQYEVGLKKNTMYGVSVDLSQSVDTRSGDSETGSTYNDIHTTIYELGMNISLWKDFLGINSRRNFKNLQELELQSKKEELISRKIVGLNFRKIYWALVANQEKTEITNSLLKTSLKQAKDAKRRQASSVSDKAEVAIFESKVSQRKGQLLYLKHEKELLLKNLRELFPELNNKELALASYNKQGATAEILACSGKILVDSSIPFEKSEYNNVVELLKSQKNRQSKIDQNHDDIDLNLQLKYQQKGLSSNSDDNTNFEGDYTDSLDDLSDNDRSGMSAALSLVIPLGKTAKTTKELQEKINEKRYYSQITFLKNQLVSTHTQVRRSMGILAEVIEAQKKNSKQLNIRVKEMKKKYSQARIPEYALFQDQEALLQSDILIIDTQLQIINTLLDYYSVFQNYPCKFNL